MRLVFAETRYHIGVLRVTCPHARSCNIFQPGVVMEFSLPGGQNIASSINAAGIAETASLVCGFTNLQLVRRTYAP